MNKYRLMSYVFLIIFFLLSTVQTLLDIQINFNTEMLPATFIFFLFASLIPVAIIIILTNYIRNKTKYSNLFVVYDIKSVIKLMFYLALLSIFIIWSVTLVFLALIICHQSINLSYFTNFILFRIIHAIIYSFIISMFFNSISKSDIKVKK